LFTFRFCRLTGRYGQQKTRDCRAIAGFLENLFSWLGISSHDAGAAVPHGLFCDTLAALPDVFRCAHHIS
jgi:hypothetical protein